ncbi:kinase-like protein [Xylariaceae sp. FL0255]|nr:kinase-like protein [Xylariaceae sp. FL0255]
MESLDIQASRDRILRDLLHLSEADLICEHRRFIPRRSLCDSLTRVRISTHLKYLEPLSSDNLAISIAPEACPCKKDICTGKRLIFASLLRIGRENCIKDAIDAGLCDSSPECLFDLTDDEKGRELLKNTQWQLRSHYLSPTTYIGNSTRKSAAEYTLLDRELAIPLIHKRSQTNTRTPSSALTDEAEWIETTVEHEITNIRIHADHHDLDDNTGSDVFIMKTFKRSEASKKRFIDEVKAHRQAPQHDRIVPLLLAFEYRDEFHLIFPLATMEDLQALWVKNEIRPDTMSIFWILEQCKGIAQALRAMHEGPVSLLHADIKASNILCFCYHPDSPPVLKLADLGFSREFEPSRTLNIKAANIPHTQTYRAPEFETEAEVYPEYDVWSLGCTYLEFVTWAILGRIGIEEFREGRLKETDEERATKRQRQRLEDTFFMKKAISPSWFDVTGAKLERIDREITQDQMKKTETRSKHGFWYSRGPNKVSCHIKPSVKKQFHDLRANNDCGTELRLFLNIIETDLIVIDPKERRTSEQTAQYLESLCQRHFNSR